MKLLIIPDPHANPDYDNDRFKALGKFIMHEKPEVIVCLGDMADLPLCHHTIEEPKDLRGAGIEKI